MKKEDKIPVPSKRRVVSLTGKLRSEVIKKKSQTKQKPSHVDDPMPPSTPH